VSLEKEIEQDISQFFREIKGMSSLDKKKTLSNLMDKYLHITTATILLDKQDFELIKGNAAKLYIDRAWPKNMKEGFSREIAGSDAVNISLMEATIMHLNYKDCLKKNPKFNYEE